MGLNSWLKVLRLTLNLRQLGLLNFPDYGLAEVTVDSAGTAEVAVPHYALELAEF